MTLSEYSARMLAFNLSNVDKLRELHLQAWLNTQADAVDSSGKPVFKTFEDFFDYEKEIKNVFNPEKHEKDMNPELVKIAKRLQEYRGKEEK